MILPEIRIDYKGIPKEIVEEYQANIGELASVEIINTSEEPHNFDGAAADVVIWFNEYYPDIIKGILESVFVGSLAILWKRIVAFYKQKGNSKENDSKRIAFNFTVRKGKTISFMLEGNVDETSVAILCKQLFEYLKDEQQYERDFANKDFRNRESSGAEITMTYNAKSDMWESFNYAESERKIDELLRDAEDKFSS